MPDETSSAVAYARRIQEEIEVEAARRRRDDRELVLYEQEVERVWGQSAPGAAGRGQERLLDRIDQLTLIDANAPTGAKRGASQVKRTVRKLTRWYMAFVVNQLNALHHFQARLLKEMDARLTRLERDARMRAVVGELAAVAPQADPGLVHAVTARLVEVEGPVLVVSCGGGAIVDGLDRAGVAAHGVDDSAAAIGSAADAGLDLRLGPLAEHFRVFADRTLGAVVLTGAVEHHPVGELLLLLDESLRCVSAGGRVVVAVADPSSRTGPEAELLAGCGLAPETWAHLLEKRGCDTELVSLQESRVSTMVLARIP